MQKGYAQESMHLDLQMAAQQVQNLTFFVMAHVSSYDPGTHRIKAIIPTFTDSESGQYMETGWIQLGTLWAGNGFGLQIAPYGGANVNDITGQNNADGKPVNPEQIVLMIISQDNTLTVGGVLTFNSVDVPPGTGQPLMDDFGNPLRLQLSSGEAIMRHSSGSYLLFRNDGSININSDTSPQVPFQEPSTDSLERDLNLSSNTNLDSGAPDATTLTANSNLLAITGNPDVSVSVPSGGTLNSTVQVTAAANGQNTNTGNSTINLETNGENLTSHGLINLQAINTGTDVENEITLTAVANGTGTNTATGNFQATATRTGANAQMTVQTTANDGTAATTVGAASENQLSTTTLFASGMNAKVNINADGKVVITTPLTNIVSTTINCGVGTFKRVLTDIAAQIYNNHTHGGVTTGGGDTGVPNQTITSGDEAQNLYAS